MNNYQLFIKDIFSYEFKRLSIPPGHHKISLNNNQLNVIADSKEFGYPNKCDPEVLTRLFICDIDVSVKETDLLITIKELINKDKLTLYKEYPQFYFTALTIKQINYIDLYKQLKVHRIDDIINQELFTNICILDETYYSDLYNMNYSDGKECDYKNNELIKLFLNLPNIVLEYRHLVSLIQSLNREDLSYILKYIKLDDNNENYYLLKDSLKVGSTVLSVLLNNFIDYNDKGIIYDLLNNWHYIGDTINMFDLLIDNNKVIYNINNLMDIAIENNIIYVFKKLLDKVDLSNGHYDLLYKYKRTTMLKLIK